MGWMCTRSRRGEPCFSRGLSGRERRDLPGILMGMPLLMRLAMRCFLRPGSGTSVRTWDLAARVGRCAWHRAATGDRAACSRGRVRHRERRRLRDRQPSQGRATAGRGGGSAQRGPVGCLGVPLGDRDRRPRPHRARGGHRGDGDRRGRQALIERRQSSADNQAPNNHALGAALIVLVRRRGGC